MLPMTVLRRFDCVLKTTKDQVLAAYERLQAKDYPEALIDAKVGETRTYTVPNGNTVKVTLVSAEPYHS